MQMFNNLESGFLAARVHELVNESQSIGPLEEKAAVFARIHSLVDVLAKNARPLSDYVAAYPDLRFQENESLPIDVFMGPEATRAEAVDMRNRLVYEGLMFFRLNFGKYGDYVEPLRDTPESTALDRMRLDYGHDWKVFRNANNDTYNFIRKQAEEEDLANRLATGMADECKERWPWAWIVVRVPIMVGDGEPTREAKAVRK